MAQTWRVGDRRWRRDKPRTLEQVESRLWAASSQRRLRVGRGREGGGIRGEVWEVGVEGEGVLKVGEEGCEVETMVLGRKGECWEVV